MNPQRPKKSGKPKRPRTGGPAPSAFALKEFSGVTLGRAMTMASEGRDHDAEAEQAAYLLAACLQYRQRPDFQEPDTTYAKEHFRHLSPAIRHAESKERATEWETQAERLVIKWLLQGLPADEGALPKRLESLARLLKSRPLRPDLGINRQAILPAPAMPEVLAVLSLAFEATWHHNNSIGALGDDSGKKQLSIEEIAKAIGRLPIQTRRASLDRTSPGLDERRARKLINQLWGIMFPRGARKKTA